MTPQRRTTPRPVAAAEPAAGALRTAVLIAFAAGFVATLPGCVTERIEPSGRISPYIAPGVDPSRPRTAFKREPASTSPAAITSPAARFSTQTLGDFPTDGLSLPLISPDARHIALRVGSAPQDELRLAPAPRQGEAVPRIVIVEPTDLSRIEIFRLQPPHQPTPVLLSNEPSGTAPTSIEEPIPHGVLLGRSCTDEGFLIEWPRADGSRWIGFVRWSSAMVTWLVRSDEHVPWLAASNAVLSTRGDLFFAYRTDPAQGWSLARRSREGTFDELDRSHAPIRWPVLSFSGNNLAQCVVREDRVRIERVETTIAKPRSSSDPDDQSAVNATHDWKNAKGLDLGPAQHTLELYNATMPQHATQGLASTTDASLAAGSFESSTTPDDTLISEWNQGFMVLETGQTGVSMWNSRMNRLMRVPSGVMSVHVRENGLFFTSETGLSFVPHARVENRWVPTSPLRIVPDSGLVRSSSVRHVAVIHPIEGSSGLIRALIVKVGDLESGK
jgi:hypothetical protein